MSEAEQLAFFTDYTDKLKAAAVKDSIESAKGDISIKNNEFYKKGPNTAPSGGNFYFYNSSTVAYGQQEFRKIWGERRLEDNWRRSARKVKLESISDTDGGPVISIAENESFDPETYLSRIPKTQGAIDTLTTDRNFAYYQLGLIYKEKFKEYPLAADRLETLLTYNPEERLVLPAKYNLFKIYEQMENIASAEKYKNDIINNHGDSRYAEILRNPNSALATDESSPEFKYKELYKEFEASNYQQVINKCDEYITVYNGNSIVPKLELLKATALGRQDGFEAYKTALNYVSLNYPNVEEGKQAQEIYTTILPALSKKEFVNDEESTSFKVVYQFKASERESAVLLKEKLDKALTYFNYFKNKSSIDYYKPGEIFVIVHGFNTIEGGRRFGDVLREHKEYKISKEHFEISTPNYKTIQIHKNLLEYLNIGLE